MHRLLLLLLLCLAPVAQAQAPAPAPPAPALSATEAQAVLDVLRDEPPQPGNRVWGHPKAFVTPHIAAQASADTVARQCLENLRRLRAGEPLLNLVDVARGY